MKEIKKLSPYLKPYIPLLAVSLVLLSIVGAVEGLILMFLEPIFNSVLSTAPATPGMAQKFAFLYDWFDLKGPGLLIRVAVILFVLTLIKCVCLYFADYAVIYTGQRIIQ